MKMWFSWKMWLVAGVGMAAAVGSCVETKDNPDYDPPGSGSGAGDSGSGGGSGSGSACGGCPTDTPVCDEESATCVACLGEQGCEGDAPVCLAGDTPSENRCVACTPEREQELCKNDEDQPSSCNPATYTCTNTQLASLGDCRKCVSDSECGGERRCVPMKFGAGESSTDREGGYCLEPTSATCTPPYESIINNRVSLSGAEAANYCGIDEAVTTCEAVLQYNDGKACSAPTECGVQGLTDSRCETREGDASATCTYTCGLDDECPGSAKCGCPESDLTCSNRFCGGKLPPPPESP